MAIGDIPRFPHAYKPRGEKLIQKLREKKISAEEVQNHIYSALGKASIGAEGVKVTGDFGSFEIGADDFQAINGSLKKLVDFLPVFNGRELYIQKGEKITRLKIGLPPKIRTGTKGEIDISDLPGIELPSGGSGRSTAKSDDKFQKKLSSYFGIKSHSSGNGNGGGNIKFDKLEDLVEWLGDGWDGMVKLLEMSYPLIDLTVKEKLDKIGESFPPFWDDVFKRCGV